jgi:hypothetical protein
MRSRPATLKDEPIGTTQRGLGRTMTIGQRDEEKAGLEGLPLTGGSG